MPGPDPFPLELTPLNPDEETAAASDSMTSISGKVSNPGSTNSSMQVSEIGCFVDVHPFHASAPSLNFYVAVVFVLLI